MGDKAIERRISCLEEKIFSIIDILIRQNEVYTAVIIGLAMLGGRENDEKNDG